MIKIKINFVLAVLAVLILLSFAVAVSPSGASDITSVNNSTAPAGDPASIPAIAGNVTEISITGFTTTQSWQGYFGNVSGTIQLADGGDKVMYNWSLANPSGEVYASTTNSISWSSVECFNVSSDGDSLETLFGINNDDVDGVNETFAIQNHDEFYTNNIHFAENDCYSVQLYDSSGGSTDGTFEEVLLTADGGTTPIFTSILEEGSINGFDSKDHDFQMLVLEDGHLTDTDTTQYYFYVELQ